MEDLELRKHELERKEKLLRKELLEVESDIRVVDWKILESTCGCEIKCENCRFSTVTVAVGCHKDCLQGKCVLCEERCKSFLPDTTVSAYLKKESVYDEDYEKLDYCIYGDIFLDKNLNKVIELLKVIK